MENEITKHCVAKHIKAFYDQAREGRAADFGEPCRNCKFSNKCGNDWLPKIKTALTEEVSISMVN